MDKKPKNLPKVTKRTYKQPEDLFDQHPDFEKLRWTDKQVPYYKYDHYYDRDVFKTEIDNASHKGHYSHGDVYILDQTVPGSKWVYSHSFKNSSKEGKYFCIGGPNAGSMMISSEAKGYLMFNRNSNYGKYDKVPKAILVYAEDLK